MKPQNVLALFLSSFALGERSVRAEIYKYVDPSTGAIEYTISPKQGAVRLSNGDTLSEIRTGAKADHASVCGSPPKTLATEADVDAEKERIAKCNQEREVLSAIHRKKRATDATAINKLYPGACRQLPPGGWICLPRVGMRVDQYQDVLGLNQQGYIEDEKGKVDRWSANGCQVLVRGAVIISVKC